MITVHYLDNSRAHRILWLLEELNVPYEIRSYLRGADMLAPASLKAIHPLGKSPIIEDGDLILAESGAIIEYLVSKYGKDNLLPEHGSPEWLNCIYWLHYTEGSLMPILLMKLVFSALPTQVPFFIRPFAQLISAGISKKLLDPQIKDNVAYWESELQKGGWFAGSAFSVADIQMSYPVEAGASFIDYGTDNAAIKAYLAAIRERPAYQRAIEKGGTYSFVKTEI